MGLREEYGHQLAIPTRWYDNDVHGHVNHGEYFAFFDTVINAFLIREGGLDIHGGPAIGLCAESHCSYAAAVSFPETVQAGLRVSTLGNSSVRSEIGLYRDDDRETRRPVPIPDGVRTALATITA